MTKNKPIRFAAFLLVIAILTTSILYGTLAKYITGDSATDSARVAKFGVTVAMNGSLYGDEYSGPTGNTIIAYSDDNAGTVKADTETENVVAPGTKSNKGFGFSVTGTPEVDVTLTATIETQNIYLKEGSYAVMVEAENVTAENFAAGTYYTLASGTYTKATSGFSGTATYYKAIEAVTVAADYYPVVYSMTGTDTEYDEGDVDGDSLGAIAKLIAQQLSGNDSISADAAGKFEITQTYEANTDLATALALSANKISWAWDFDASTAGTYDGADTILGNLMAGSAKNGVVVKSTGTGTYAAPEPTTDYNLNTSFDMSITVTQID